MFTPTFPWSKLSIVPNLLALALKDDFRKNISELFNWHKSMHIPPLSRVSLIKCWSTSACFLRLSWPGLWEVLIAVLLSQYKFIELEKETFNFPSNLFNHSSLQTSCATALNSFTYNNLLFNFFKLLLQQRYNTHEFHYH